MLIPTVRHGRVCGVLSGCSSGIWLRWEAVFRQIWISDVLTLFLALDTEVELVHAGRMTLAEFACSKRDRDVLVRLIVKKHEGVTVYQSHRNSRTDFPVLTCAVRVETEKDVRCLGQDRRRRHV